MKRIILAAMFLAALSSCKNNINEETAMNEGNAVIETIMSRRSIRNYKQEPVDRETMEKIIECGINAPSGQNKQSWEVRIIDDPAIMEEFNEAMAKGHPDMDPEMAKGCFRGAPVMAFIARDMAYPFSAYDCGLLAENMMLSAWSLGVGSVCLGSPVMFLSDNEACAPCIERLGFSEGYKLCLCVGFGYPNETPDAKPRDRGKVKFVE